jgi:hypothetical protein
MCKAEVSLSVSERSVLQQGFEEIRGETANATSVSTLRAPGGHGGSKSISHIDVQG